MSGTMLVYARAVLQSEAEAEDAVRDAFVVACARYEVLLSCENPQGWLMVTLRNVCRNALRARARARTAEASVPASFEPPAPAEEDNPDILYGDLLGADYTLLRRLAVDGLTIQEAADELGISPQSCRKRAQRAREKLRKKLSDSYK